MSFSALEEVTPTRFENPARQEVIIKHRKALNFERKVGSMPFKMELTRQPYYLA
jgi:hypothetical protein